MMYKRNFDCLHVSEVHAKTIGLELSVSYWESPWIASRRLPSILIGQAKGYIILEILWHDAWPEIVGEQALFRSWIVTIPEI